MTGPTLVVAGKTTMAIAGALAVRAEADSRGFDAPILLVPNATDDGTDGWQPSLRRFASTTPGFELAGLEEVYALPHLYFFSLEFDRLVRTERTLSENLFNIHFSLLPAYKGMSTSIWPILEGRTESGVTLHRILSGIDTGPIISQVSFAIEPQDTGRDLYLKYIEHGTKLFGSMAGRLLDGDFEAEPQPAQGSSYFSKSDLDYSAPITSFAKTAFELHNRIRAFTFPEYQLVRVDGLDVTASTITETLSSARPGTVVERGPGRRRISTVDYELVLTGHEA